MTLYLPDPQDLDYVRKNLSVHQVNTENGPIVLDLHYFKHENSTDNTPMLLICHGLGEHIDMFEGFFHTLMKNFTIDLLMYNQRSHGPKLMQPNKVLSFIPNLLSADLINVIEFVNKNYPTKNLFLYGNSNGGAVILNTALSNLSRFSELKITGVIFENPYIKVHNNQANLFLRILVRLLGSILPNIVVPKEIDCSKISHNQEQVDMILADPFYQYKMTFGTAKTSLNLAAYLQSNMQNWPKHIPYSMNLADQDFIVDHLAGKKFHEINKKLHHENEMVMYPGAYHSLKKEVGEVCNKFVSTMKNFIQRF